jgi:Ca2+-dependent lipid-binding protein
MKTKVIKNNLNPIWNESTILKNADRNATLYLELYDRDHMK